jgi:hypothetical protein
VCVASPEFRIWGVCCCTYILSSLEFHISFPFLRLGILVIDSIREVPVVVYCPSLYDLTDSLTSLTLEVDGVLFILNAYHCCLDISRTIPRQAAALFGYSAP